MRLVLLAGACPSLEQCVRTIALGNAVHFSSSLHGCVPLGGFRESSHWSSASNPIQGDQMVRLKHVACRQLLLEW